MAMEAADMTGHYYLRGVMEVGSELLLKPDGKFEFMLANGAADYWGRGSWKAVDGAVVLTSDPSNHGDPFALVKSEAGKGGGDARQAGRSEGEVAPNFNRWDGRVSVERREAGDPVGNTDVCLPLEAV